DPTQLAQTLQERIVERIGGDGGTDPEDLPRLLRPGGERRGEEAAREHTHERPPFHYSMTWSALASSEGGIVSPRALAVLRLITNPNRANRRTGTSGELGPKSPRGTYFAASRPPA